MANCPFFREHLAYYERRVNTTHMGALPPIVNKTPWCAHKHSPRGKPQGVELLGGQTRLVCAGALDACQVPEEKRRDYR
jgi:hypothetical protein